MRAKLRLPALYSLFIEQREKKNTWLLGGRNGCLVFSSNPLHRLTSKHQPPLVAVRFLWLMKAQADVEAECRVTTADRSSDRVSFKLQEELTVEMLQHWMFFFRRKKATEVETKVLKVPSAQ